MSGSIEEHHWDDDDLRIVETFEFEQDIFDDRADIRTRKLKLFYSIIAILCILAGLLAMGSGIFMLVSQSSSPHNIEAHATTHKSLNSRHRPNIYIDTNFGQIILFFVGLDCVWKVLNGDLTVTSTLSHTVLFLAFGNSLCGVASQLANMGMLLEPRSVLKCIFFLLFNLFAACLCACQIYLQSEIVICSSAHFCASIRTGTGPYNMQFTRKQRPGRITMICLLALTQLVVGFSVSILLLKSESNFQRSLKISDEIGGTPWLVVSASVSILWTVYYEFGFELQVDGLRKSSLILQILALIVSCRFLNVPLEILYTFSSDVRVRFDDNLQFTIILLGITAYVTLIVTISCSISYSEKCDQSKLTASRIKEQHYLDWSTFRCAPFLQIALVLCYVSLLGTGIYHRQLSVNDFTPLPMLTLAHVIFALLCYRDPKFELLLLNFVWMILCAIFAFRDIYLFNYHVAKHGEGPDIVQRVLQSEYSSDRADNNLSFHRNNSSPFDGDHNFANGSILYTVNVTLYVAMIMTSTLELLLSITLSSCYNKAINEIFTLTFNRNVFGRRIKLLYFTGAIHLLMTFVLLYCAFVTFLANSFTAENFGDHALYLAIFSLLASSLTIATGKFHNCLTFALILQILFSFLCWNFLDYGSFTLASMVSESNHPNFTVPVDQFGREPHQNAVGLSILSFVLANVLAFVGFLNIAIIFPIIDRSEVIPRSQNIFAL